MVAVFFSLCRVGVGPGWGAVHKDRRSEDSGPPVSRETNYAVATEFFPSCLASRIRRLDAERGRRQTISFEKPSLKSPYPNPPPQAGEGAGCDPLWRAGSLIWEVVPCKVAVLPFPQGMSLGRQFPPPAALYRAPQLKPRFGVLIQGRPPKAAYAPPQAGEEN
jgi:hypothetical protein